MSSKFQDAGTHEGVGVLIVASKFDLFSDPQADDDEKNELLNEAKVLIENLLGFVSTASVVFTVVLSVDIPLVCINLMLFQPQSSSLGGDYGGSGEDDDGTAYGFYRESSNNSDMLHVFHWLECILLFLSIFLSVRGIFSSFLGYGAFAIYMVTIPAKYRFLVKYHKFVGDIWGDVAGCLMCLATAIPFLCSISIALSLPLSST